MPHEPRHDDCRRCVFWNARRLNVNCLRCGAGEFFEEKVEEKALPDADELQEIVAGMTDDE
jgi:hypothetical protein